MVGRRDFLTELRVLVPLGQARVLPRRGVRRRGHPGAAGAGRTGPRATAGAARQGSYPEARTERRAYDVVAEGFGPGATGPGVVAVDLSQDRTVVDPPGGRAGRRPGHRLGRRGADGPAGDVAVIMAQPTTTPQDVGTARTLERVREQVLPGALAGSPATARVGGYTATLADLSQRVAERLPVFLAAVVAMPFLLLMLLFRSILVPLKAVDGTPAS